MEKLKNVPLKVIGFVLWAIFSAFIAWLVNKGASAFFAHDYMTETNADPVGEFWTGVLVYPFQLNMEQYGLLTLATFLAVLFLGLYYVETKAKRDRNNLNKGEEYGSARWATKGEMQDFKAKDFEDNFLLSANSAISIPAIKRREGVEKLLKGKGVSDRNKHILIVGGSGSGKTFNEVGPNLLQSKCSFISTDPKGDTVKKYGQWLIDRGYNVKVVNIKDTESFPYSFKYNPFKYITDQASIMNLVSIIIENTSGSDDAQAKEDFWVKSERCLYLCLISYLYYAYEDQPQYKNIPTMLDFIGTASASEQNEEAKSELDVIMEKWKDALIWTYGSEEEAKLQPEWFTITQYEGFKKAAGETAKSIIISCFVRLSPFAIGAVRDMFMDDELELEKIGEEKTALFLVMSDTNKTFNFIMAMIFYQLFDINVRVADANPGSHCEIPIMCILDEMANIGRIPDLDVKIATLRSRWINLVPILQSLSQMDSVYGKEKSATIKSNCDTFVYLGRGDYQTCEEISKMLGKETIKVTSKTKQRNGSSVSTQSITRDLLSPDELYANPDRFADDECLVMIKLARPYKDKKFMLFDHPSYEAFSKTPELNVEEFVTEKRKLAREAIEKEKEAVSAKSEEEKVKAWREEQKQAKAKAQEEENEKESYEQAFREYNQKLEAEQKQFESEVNEDKNWLASLFALSNENKAKVYCFC